MRNPDPIATPAPGGSRETGKTNLREMGGGGLVNASAGKPDGSLIGSHVREGNDLSDFAKHKSVPNSTGALNHGRVMREYLLPAAIGFPAPVFMNPTLHTALCFTSLLLGIGFGPVVKTVTVEGGNSARCLNRGSVRNWIKHIVGITLPARVRTITTFGPG